MTAAAEKKEVTIGGAVGVPPAGAVALRSLTMRNVLSFGAEATVELGALNVLIGANGCGKSNLMDVIALLKAAATTDLSDEFRGGGAEWPWKGGGEKLPEMQVESEWQGGDDVVYRHRIAIRVRESGEYAILSESMDVPNSAESIVRGEDAKSRDSILRVGTPIATCAKPEKAIAPKPAAKEKKLRQPKLVGAVQFMPGVVRGQGVSGGPPGAMRTAQFPEVLRGAAILEFFRDENELVNAILAGTVQVLEYDGEKEKEPLLPFSEMEAIRRSISLMAEDFRIYRSRHVGRTGRGQNPLRVAGPADKLNNKVSESLDNFPNVLNRVYADSECKKSIDEKMREFYGGARGVYFNVAHGAVEAVLQESSEKSTPTSRMSDGMLNWLFLLTVLLDPKPPALMCIDEPETGLHPDMFSALAKLLIDASKRMQLIVATHAHGIVDMLTDMPETVVVCDKTAEGATTLHRLNAEEVRDWEEEGLGMAWASGAIGGTRW